MRAIEVHVIETDGDISTALLSGLLEIEDLDHLVCDECEEEVGPSEDGHFSEFSVVLYEDDTNWLVCSSCSAPITERDTEFEYVFEFDELSEDIEGMLIARLLAEDELDEEE